MDRLLAADRESVAVTTTPSFASLWLAPKLAQFQQLEPAIDVRVDASEARVNLEREGLDMAGRLRQFDDQVRCRTLGSVYTCACT